MEKRNKEDTRVKKTLKALRDGLAELLAEKEIYNITVQELTDRVGLHRATFYAHYSDIYDLYGQVENSILNEVRDLFEKNKDHSSNDFCKSIFNYVSENKKICPVLFGDKADGYFFERLVETLEEKCLENWCTKWNVSSKNEALRYEVHYHVSGWISVCSRWVRSNFNYPVEELINDVAELDRKMEKYIMSKYVK